MLAALTACAAPTDPPPTALSDDQPADAAAAADTVPSATVRVAVFNVIELSAEKLDLVDDDGHGAHAQLQAAAAVLQRVRPDIVLLNEIDYSATRDLPRLFVERYLQVPQEHGGEPLDYAHVVYEPVNTGVASGFDLDEDGATDGPGDAWGWGRYPGQYGMALLSRHPVERDRVRTFRTLRWRSMPGHRMPDGVDGRPGWYEPAEAAALRLSSKSHWDVPVRIDDGASRTDGGWALHVLASHPTPPVFDGDEDRNGRRNADEIRFWADYLDGDADYLVDDDGRRGGLAQDAPFVLVGDLNADPLTEGATHGAIARLLAHPRVHDPVPRTEGTPPPAEIDYPGDDRTRTSAYGRIDYALPSRSLQVAATGVHLPPDGDPARTAAETASDHFLVWVDVALSR